MHDAWEQITTRYARDMPSLLKYNFLSVISDGANTRLGTIFLHINFIILGIKLMMMKRQQTV